MQSRCAYLHLALSEMSFPLIMFMFQFIAGFPAFMRGTHLEEDAVPGETSAVWCRALLQHEAGNLTQITGVMFIFFPFLAFKTTRF